MIVLLVITALLVACGDNATPPDASTVTCGSDEDTLSGTDLFACATDGRAGICTNDPHGFIRCFPTCTPQYECDPGSSSYVLALRDGSRACFCMPDGLP